MADDGNSDRDLFGGPLQLPRERRGRPEYVRTAETSNRVDLLFAMGRTPKQVARALGISVPTLRKHYFAELERRADAALMVEGVQLERLNRQAADGNVTAEKELMKALEKGRSRAISEQTADRQTKADRPKPVGKKEAAKATAAGVTGKFAPPPQPSLLNPSGNA